LSSKPERYQELKVVYLFGSGECREVESAWFHDATLILKFRGVDTISDAERLTGAEVRVPLEERVALDPGEFFESDLVGCEVFDRRTGERLGRVSRWMEGGGAGLLEVDGEWLIPFARSICLEIDPAARRIGVELPEGLKDLNRS
jgi:16S rRNA processing protein RimM